MDKYDALEYSWVKATSVSMSLRIYLCALINTNNRDVSKLYSPSQNLAQSSVI
jgi:hypothetical protein